MASSSTPSRPTPVTFHIVGDAYVDMFCFLDENGLPESGGDSRLVQPIVQYAGGSSTNTATHLHALTKHFFQEEQDNDADRPAVMLHTVFNENDSFGQLLIQHIARRGFLVSNCYLHQSNNNDNDETLSTGHCVAIVSGGERSFMTHQGVVGAFTADHLDLSRIIQTNHDVHVHIAGYFNVEGFHNGNLRRALEQIRQERSSHNSTTVSLVTQHDAHGHWDGGLVEVAPLLDFLIMNELEANSILKHKGSIEIPNTAATLTNTTDPLQDETVQAWLKYFSAWDPTTCVIVTLGAQGAVAFRNHTLVATVLPAVQVDVVDPTGAGDSFTAGFLHGLWEWKRQSLRVDKEVDDNDVTPTNGDYFMSSHKTPWPPAAIQQGLIWGCAVGTSAVTIRGACNPAPSETIRAFYQMQQDARTTPQPQQEPGLALEGQRTREPG